jgi:antitoxin Phd
VRDVGNSKGRVRVNRERRNTTYTATKAKNDFGKVLEKVIQGETIVITRHDAPKAVLMSMDKFNTLSHAAEFQLDSLSSEFDALLARMQTPKAGLAMKAAFHASPRQLGNAAVAAARKRG